MTGLRIVETIFLVLVTVFVSVFDDCFDDCFDGSVRLQCRNFTLVCCVARVHHFGRPLDIHEE
jgi:hypothetical protein